MPKKILSLALAFLIGAGTLASSIAVLLVPGPKEPAPKAPKQKVEVVKVVEKKQEPKNQVVETRQEPERPSKVQEPVKQIANTPKPQKPYRRAQLSWQEIQLLAHMVQGEARGEPFIGKVAVAAVVLNRLERPNFPSTVAGIIYGQGEFCTVRDGQINLSPSSEAYRAVEQALGGWDPSYGSLYFYNPARSTSKWIYSRPVNVKYGQHVFAG